jgi:hypothetical protein
MPSGGKKRGQRKTQPDALTLEYSDFQGPEALILENKTRVHRGRTGINAFSQNPWIYRQKMS